MRGRYALRGTRFHAQCALRYAHVWRVGAAEYSAPARKSPELIRERKKQMQNGREYSRSTTTQQRPRASHSTTKQHTISSHPQQQQIH